jgi:uncharacterized protein YecE (DUF72 family)
MPAAVRVGCAGWSIPAATAAAFPGPGSQLERYARVFDAVEINSTFHRSHRPATYERWAASVPAAFRFSAKLPKAITHVRRLAGAEDELGAFLDGVRCLGGRLGPLLVQLPPSLAFDPGSALAFLEALRRLHGGPVACEPRHATWFRADVEAALAERRVARVAADPPPVPGAWRPGGWPGLAYFRLHGSPQIYRSSYDDRFLEWLETQLTGLADGAEAWVVFDNTAAGAATANARALLGRLRGRAPRP